MTDWVWILIVVSGIILASIFGCIVGFRLRKPNKVGTLLVLTDPVDGEKFMQLEILRGKDTLIYDGNEVTMDVIEIIGKNPQEKQTV